MQRPLRRRSVRNPDDFYNFGSYLVTVCSAKRAHIFGSVVADTVRLSPLGLVVESAWVRTFEKSQAAISDAFVIMPNHIHLVVSLNDLDTDQGRHGRCGLGRLIGDLKARTTSDARNRGFPTPIWQRGFHERSLSTAGAVHAALDYVESNPANWDRDPER